MIISVFTSKGSTSDIEDDDESVGSAAAAFASYDDVEDDDKSDDDKKAKVAVKSTAVHTVKKVGLGAHNEVMVVGMEMYERFDHAYFASRVNEITGGGLTAQAAPSGCAKKQAPKVGGAKGNPPVKGKPAVQAPKPAKSATAVRGKHDKGIGEDDGDN